MINLNKTKGDLGEEYVIDKFSNSFLKYFIYKNPKDSETINKEEIADVIVVFSSIVIIIQNKDIKPDEFGNIKDKAVDKNTKQTFGAYRKIKEIKKGKVKLKNDFTKEEEFFDLSGYKFYLITSFSSTTPFAYDPLVVSKGGDIAHLMYKDSIDKIFQYLSSPVDFVKYLEFRESLLMDQNNSGIPQTGVPTPPVTDQPAAPAWTPPATPVAETPAAPQTPAEPVVPPATPAWTPPTTPEVPAPT
jgi:hypothetical protein